MEINLEDIMKQTAISTIESMTIPIKEFDSKHDAALHYHEHLDDILSDFEESFKTDLQAFIAKNIAETS